MFIAILQAILSLLFISSSSCQSFNSQFLNSQICKFPPTSFYTVCMVHVRTIFNVCYKLYLYICMYQFDLQHIVCPVFHFLQVCFPFLLFCLGIDPKTDISSLLLQVIQDLNPQTKTLQSKGAPSRGPLTPHQLFLLLSSSVPVEYKILDTPTSPYPSVPSQVLLSTGCHAFLQLIGTGLYLEKSLVNTSKFKYI